MNYNDPDPHKDFDWGQDFKLEFSFRGIFELLGLIGFAFMCITPFIYIAFLLIAALVR